MKRVYLTGYSPNVAVVEHWLQCANFTVASNRGSSPHILDAILRMPLTPKALGSSGGLLGDFLRRTCDIGGEAKFAVVSRNDSDGLCLSDPKEYPPAVQEYSSAVLLNGWNCWWAESRHSLCAGHHVSITVRRAPDGEARHLYGRTWEELVGQALEVSL